MIRFHFYVEFENKTQKKHKLTDTKNRVARGRGRRWAKWVKGIRRQTFQLQSK